MFPLAIGLATGALQMVGQAISGIKQASQKNAANGQSTAPANQIPLRERIRNAVTQALQTSRPGDDPNVIVRDAIARTLQGADQGVTDTGYANLPEDQKRLKFKQILAAHGIDEQQFHADFNLALESARQTGKLDFNQLLKSLPPGTGMNVVG